MKGIALCVAALTACLAEANLVNASFEEPNLSGGAFTSSGIEGWTSGGGGSGVWNTTGWNAYDEPLPDGDQVGYINGGSVSQVSTWQIEVGVNQVKFMVGHRRGYAGTATYELYAGGSASAGLITGGTLIDSITIDNNDIANARWASYTLDYTASGSDALLGQNLGIRIFKAAGGQQVNFDNFGHQVVPEPGTLAALGLGAVLLIRKRKR